MLHLLGAVDAPHQFAMFAHVLSSLSSFVFSTRESCMSDVSWGVFSASSCCRRCAGRACGSVFQATSRQDEGICLFRVCSIFETRRVARHFAHAGKDGGTKRNCSRWSCLQRSVSRCAGRLHLARAVHSRLCFCSRRR